MLVIVVLFVLLLILLILIGQRKLPNRIYGGVERGAIILVSYPKGCIKLGKAIRDELATIKTPKFNVIDQDRDSLPSQKIGGGKVVVVGSNLRSDVISLPHQTHIHCAGLEIHDMAELALAKTQIQQQMDCPDPEKMWDKYWDDLCHMDIHAFLSSPAYLRNAISEI